MNIRYLKRIISEEINSILNEGKQVGKIYHFTNIYSLIDILDDDVLKGNSLVDPDWIQIYLTLK